MKKLIGAICSLVAGALTFVFLSIPNIVSTLAVALLGSTTKSETAWEILENYDSNTDGYVLFKIAIIVMIVFACLSIITGILLLFKNLGTIKAKANINLINNVMLSLLAAATIVAFVATIIMCNYFGSDAFVVATKGEIGIGMWLNFAINIVLCTLAFVFANPVKTKKISKR